MNFASFLLLVEGTMRVGTSLLVLLLVRLVVGGEEVRQYKINVDERVLVALSEKLESVRLPQVVEGVGWERGVDVGYLSELVEYWKTDFDWRKQEKMLNSVLPQFTTQINGLEVHFAHIRSQNKSALPLLFLHGWPGSFLEAVKIAPLLTDKFHLVAPSLPGYGMSEPPKEPGMTPMAMGRIFTELMSRLNYERYVVQGGDWGSVVCTYMGVNDPRVAGVHLNMIPTLPPFSGKGILATIQTGLKAIFPFLHEDPKHGEKILRIILQELGYMHTQATRPHTLAVALSDSPIGLLAWIVEKFYVWGDCNGNIESRFEKDLLLSNVMLYWISNNIGPSMQLYYEFMNSDEFLKLELFNIDVKKPTGFANFPKELFKQPKSDTSYFYNICQWTEFESGGHFAALEEPENLAKDIISFTESCVDFPSVSLKNEL